MGHSRRRGKAAVASHNHPSRRLNAEYLITALAIGRAIAEGRRGNTVASQKPPTSPPRTRQNQ
ncbi:hypothetical protein GNF10_33020 [Nostoc sp. UCD121]|uniref:hypothetical protein n=1 Tax=Nostoc sp. UCD121 TaxID=2681305 RepID=UPI001624E4A2|nr:hypothetical protein [Nostoc sp. UCD121]MBC1280631.1 hypothetical protein [Nostoc sp. UCD121]MBC1280632.1 hypothetical protein [Nostoc sp. UCD121]MBC1299149.1 hypothetical protein [Nostoc sp. UCD122]MBC1299150.1 hypothetical protein [Nostoc sp. UCD122]